MCRSIKTLHNFAPPATEEEIRASSLQFVRKLSGFTRPSKANQVVFDRAVDQVARAARELLDGLVTSAAPRDRVAEASKARAEQRVGTARRPRRAARPERPRYGEVAFGRVCLRSGSGTLSTWFVQITVPSSSVKR